MPRARNSPEPADYPAYMANNPENPRGVHAVRVLQGKDDFTLDSLIEAAYDPALPFFDDLIPRLLLITAVDSPSIIDEDGNAVQLQSTVTGEILDYIDLLRGWDTNFGVDSVETSLAVYWAEALMEMVRADAAAADINIYDYMVNNATPNQLLGALNQAAETLSQDFGSWQVHGERLIAISASPEIWCRVLTTMRQAFRSVLPQAGGEHWLHSARVPIRAPDECTAPVATALSQPWSLAVR